MKTKPKKINKYDPKKIEPKWLKVWEKSGIYEAEDTSKKDKFYGLIEFPFPSGDGMHVGHLRSNTAMDIIARKRRMQGFNVLYPIGWDAFGLPTENFAIKTGQSPKVVTKKNTDNFRKQLKAAGFSFDWSREINTTDPEYYKWTQWIFLKMFEKGLAYKKRMLINWCPKDKIGLANEEVIDGKCERCGTPVEKREKEQWMLAITKYADRLDKDLDTVDYLEKIKIQQRNWIGKSEGAEIEFKLKSEAEPTFYQFFEPGKIHEGEKYVECNAIVALVKHWAEDKYLGLKWKNVDWETLITGGIEKGQTPEEAARSEILEETGYKNLKLIKKFGTYNARFYHVPKKENRYGHFEMVYFELKDGERQTLNDDEKAKHEPVWLTPQELENFKLPSSNRYFWNLVQSKGVIKEHKVKVFTTRPDTLFGATYLVLAPEHPLVQHFIHQASNAIEIDEYVKTARNKNQIDRTADTKEKTGVELKGVKAINPATQEGIPIYIADYVLDTYGTGAIMAVPAHDERDYEFAKKYNIPIKEVVIPLRLDEKSPLKKDMPMVERNVVHTIVIHPKTKKVLTLKWKKFPWQTLPMGGIEENEDYIEAAKREIHEETGFKNVKYIRTLGGLVKGQFYAAHKNENRTSYTRAVVFELMNEEQDPIAEEEKNLFDMLWGTLDDINPCAEIDVWKERMKNPSEVYTGPGDLINSKQFTGMDSEQAIKKITEFVGGRIVTTYKLRDWVFSRQRYWGEPIPMIHCPTCDWVPVPEKDLPVKLPEVKNYIPTDTGESPLAAMTKWVQVKCPKCGGPAKRETDTMPNWAGSSWYFLRYIDPKNKKVLADRKKLDYWMNGNGVDWYNGGMEHTTLHLLYSRFWNKFLFDIGVVPTSEPYHKRTSHGLILAPDGEKMSKSRGNVVNPDSIIQEQGADTLRLYEMFMGPFDQTVAWSTDGIVGPRRFLDRVWRLQEKVEKKLPYDAALESLLHKTVKKVSEDIEAMQFNTAISALMILVNDMDTKEKLAQSYYEHLLVLLAPFAPFIVEEIWKNLGHPKSIHLEKWMEANMSKIQTEEMTIVVQINGKIRAQFKGSLGMSDKEIETHALAMPEVTKWLEGRQPKKVIVVRGKLINIVV